MTARKKPGAKKKGKSPAGSGGGAFIPCTPIVLPEGQWAEAARAAIAIFPANAPMGETDPNRVGVLAGKFWGDRAKDLPVAFLERTPAAMVEKVLAFANSWGEFSRVRFRHTADLSESVVRVSFRGGGYWSYLGTDCLQIPRNQPTLNLEGFSLSTRESEWHRVVKHEFGHALGCPHEQQRQAVLDMLDEARVIAYFKRTQGWSEQDVRDQILTPLEERSLMNASPADPTSIMCYSFPGSVTKSGQPIPGGNDFSPIDRQYFARTYPRDDAPPPPPAAGEVAYVATFDAAGRELARFKR